MGPIELLQLVGERLDACGCARFVTGSVASTVFGEPRFTNDVDIVVRMNERQAALFGTGFAGDEWYVSIDAAVDAARRRRMFDVIHVPSGFKADIVVARGTAHDDDRFTRLRYMSMPSTSERGQSVRPGAAPHAQR